MAGKLLDLNTAPRTSVFRKVVSLVRNDPTIKRVVKPASIRDWAGNPQEVDPFTVAIAPAIRFTPAGGPDQWWSPGTTRGPLYIGVEMLTEGTCADDMLNLWWAIVRAIYPATQSQTNAVVQALQAAGAYSGLAEFTMPVFDPHPEDNYFHGVGQIMIVVNNTLLAG